MGFRFTRRVNLFPGISLNFSKSGLSLSVGTRGLRATFGRKGVRKTIGIPGTGFSHTSFSKHKDDKEGAMELQEIPEESQEKTDQQDSHSSSDDIPCNWYITDVLDFYRNLHQKSPLWKIWGIGIAMLTVLHILLSGGKGVVTIAALIVFSAPFVLFVGLINPILVKQTNRIAALWVPFVYFIGTFLFLLILHLATES